MAKDGTVWTSFDASSLKGKSKALYAAYRKKIDEMNAARDLFDASFRKDLVAAKKTSYDETHVAVSHRFGLAWGESATPIAPRGKRGMDAFD